jgi:anti-sigma-K factor RskA
MDCTKAKSLISDYSVGLLSDRTKSDFEGHLDSCPDCKSALEKLERVMSVVDSLPAMEPPAGLWNGVYNRIAVDAPSRRTYSERLRDVFGLRSVRWSAGLAAAGLIIALSVSRVQTPKPIVAYAAGEYAQGHAIFASRDFLADQIALTSSAAIADREQAGMQVQ